jgi:DNA helicase-2/ATP-dependent DNA helicase PcrA
LSPEDPGYLGILNPEQRRAVVHHGSPLLILAGAGSGKTRVITTKIAWLVDRMGMSPRSILAVTFTNKAAQEMKDRVTAIVPHAEEVMVRTFHSFGAWFLRRNAAVAGLDPHFSIYDEEDSVSLLRGILGKSEDRGFLRRAYEEISRVKDLGIGADATPEEIARAGCGPEIYAAYERGLRATGNVDFGDLILLPARLLAADGTVRERTRQRFTAILVDEYQDSNIAQFELLKQLWQPGAYLCVVGDDDQSIYGFRGAEVGNILTFPTVFPGTEIVRLERNYRSTQSILDVASAVVAHNKGRLGKTLWTEQGGGALPTIACLEDQDEEAEFCGRLATDGREGTTAILYRMNAQSRHFEDWFSRNHVMYRLIGSVRFYSREEVKDAVAYLSLIANPRDEVSFRRAVNTPGRGVGPASVEKILAEWRSSAQAGEPGRETPSPIIAACRRLLPRMAARTRAGLDQFLACIDDCAARLSDLPLAELARLVLSRSGLYEMYKGRDKADGTAKTGNLEEMVSAMASHGAGPAALIGFLESVALASPTDDDGRSRDPRVVTLITLHNTKGLEFDRVIITGLEESIFPHESSSRTEEDLEEERRLFYVGITRARAELLMTWCRRRRIFGRTTDMAPSRFLDEVPEGAAARIGDEQPPGGDEGFPPGAGVFHDEYGTGVVERAWYTDGSLVVQVRFQSGRVAKFLPKYARLERVSLGE